jgi:hypothetical protein
MFSKIAKGVAVTMKVIAAIYLGIGITLLAIILVGGFVLFLKMSLTIDEISKKHRLGVTYMEGLSSSEKDFIILDAQQLMNSHNSQYGYTDLGPFSGKPVPDRWQAVGVGGIKYSSDSVYYYFCGGGPVERTLLKVVRDADRSMTVEAWYRTEEHPKMLFRTQGELDSNLKERE